MFKAIFKFSEGLILGAAGGYAAGLLCAPKTGKQLRAEISDHSEQLYQQASRKFDDLADATTHTVHDMQLRASGTMHDMQSRAADTLHDVQSQATHTMHDLQSRGEHLLRSVALNVREKGKHVAGQFDQAMTHAADSLMDEDEIIGG